MGENMGRSVIILSALMLNAFVSAQAVDSTATITTNPGSVADSTNGVEQLLNLSTAPDDSMNIAVQDSNVTDSLLTSESIEPDSAGIDSIEAGSMAVEQDSMSLPNPMVEDTTMVSETVDSTQTMEQALQTEQVEENPVLNLSLDYGYKGYAWGSDRSLFPPAKPITSIIYSRDSSSVSFWTTLGPDTVMLSYFYSDSGFWKAEVSFPLNPFDQEAQDKKFREIAIILDQIYGNPTSSSLSITGPQTTSSNPLDMDYARMFQHKSWQFMPCQIELLLISFVQDTETSYPVISGTSQLILVYYNPDYMVKVQPAKAVNKGPTIFDLY